MWPQQPGQASRLHPGTRRPHIGTRPPATEDRLPSATRLPGGRVRIWARAGTEGASCPRCGQFSRRVHSAYERRLADAPVGGQPVTIWLAVRRFFCGNPDCAAVTFAEQVEGLTSRRARRTPPLARTLTAIALALAGRAGARLAGGPVVGAGRHASIPLVRHACPEVSDER